jgi:hypothetical protein
MVPITEDTVMICVAPTATVPPSGARMIGGGVGGGVGLGGGVGDDAALGDEDAVGEGALGEARGDAAALGAGEGVGVCACATAANAIAHTKARHAV